MSNTQSRIQEQIYGEFSTDIDVIRQRLIDSGATPEEYEDYEYLLEIQNNNSVIRRPSALRGAEIALENAIKKIDKEMNKKLRGSSQDYLDGYLHGLAKASFLLTPPKP